MTDSGHCLHPAPSLHFILIADLAAKGWQPCNQVPARKTAASSAHAYLSYLLDPAQSAERGQTLHLRRLEDLLMLIARSHSRQEPSGQANQPTGSGPQAAGSSPPALVVGHLMKPSRERDLASRGVLPLVPQHGISFVPIDTALQLEQQGPFDALLHKVSGAKQPLGIFMWCTCEGWCPAESLSCAGAQLGLLSCIALLLIVSQQNWVVVRHHAVAAGH